MNEMKIGMAVALLLACSSTPLASARLHADVEVEAGVCAVNTQCTWIDNYGNTYNCESNGNIAVIYGEDNHVNYCHDESNNTSSRRSP